MVIDENVLKTVGVSVSIEKTVYLEEVHEQIVRHVAAIRVEALTANPPNAKRLLEIETLLHKAYEQLGQYLLIQRLSDQEREKHVYEDAHATAGSGANGGKGA